MHPFFYEYGDRLKRFRGVIRGFIDLLSLLERTKADSYGNEKLVRKWTKSVFFFFNLLGARMVQIRIAKPV